MPYLLHKRIELLHEPCGVVAVVAPWNFPFAIPFVQAATAVAAGNAVVVKPSELTPLTGALIEDVFRPRARRAGLVRVVQGAGDLGAALVGAGGLGKVVFTGSVASGRAVATAAAERLTPVTLELGGKHPMLVLDDADLGRAVAGAAWGSFANCGQVASGSSGSTSPPSSTTHSWLDSPRRRAAFESAAARCPARSSGHSCRSGSASTWRSCSGRPAARS